MEKEIVISKMIKKYMRIHNYTMKELGEELGKSESTVSYWINGRNNPRIGDIQKMADIFGLTTEQMLYGDDVENEEIREIPIINRALKQMTPEKRKQILNALEALYPDEFK